MPPILNMEGQSSGNSGGMQHERPTLGDLNIIAEGFVGGGNTRYGRKRYARIVLSLSTKLLPPTLNITFSAIDLTNVVPHEDDLIVLSVVLMGKNAQRVLINQGSLVDVMFGILLYLSRYRESNCDVLMVESW